MYCGTVTSASEIKGNTVLPSKVTFFFAIGIYTSRGYLNLLCNA